MTYSMQISGVSQRFDRPAANQQAAAEGSEHAGRSERRQIEKGDDGESRHRHAHRHDSGPGRQNPLVGAMMQALKGLIQGDGIKQAGATGPIATNPVEAPTAASTDAVNDAAVVAKGDAKINRAELKDAAVAFAHELFSALRGGDDSKSGDDEKKVKHHHHNHGHHFGNYRGGKSEGASAMYGDLAQRLRDLAGKLEQAAKPAQAGAVAPVAADPAQPVATDAPVAAPVTIEPDMDVIDMPPETSPLSVPAAQQQTAGINISVNININVQFNGGSPMASGAPGAAAEQAAPASPLLAAFEKLMEKLNPGASAEAGATGQATPTDRLREFLLGIAGTLKAGQAASDVDSLRPAAGSLIDIAA